MKRSVLIIGSGAREHAIAYALSKSTHSLSISCCGPNLNPGIKAICDRYEGTIALGSVNDAEWVRDIALRLHADLAVIGPEAPLEARVADTLRTAGISVFGPDADLARIETSKSYARECVCAIAPEVIPKFRIAHSIEEAQEALASFGPRFVVKADGLSGGKGVKVSKEHLGSHDEALSWCRQLFSTGQTSIVIEEKLYGQEFSLMTITDGISCIHSTPIQDHKRAFDEDCGPNTGGMGSYSSPDNLLPFLSKTDVEQACSINEQVIQALRNEFGKPYRGVLYGGYMAVSDGIRLIEYNARFGDPEALNFFTLLRSDAYELLQSAADGTLGSYRPISDNQASVCIYAVPNGYPQLSERNVPFSIDSKMAGTQIFYGSVERDDSGILRTAGSRTLAVASYADSINQARVQALSTLETIQGTLRWRTDIGSPVAVRRKIDHMTRLRKRLSVGVLGSTRGTDLRYLIDAKQHGILDVDFSLVCSDKADSGIVDLAREHDIPVCIGREHQLSKSLDEAGVDIILLIGYMRILSAQFCLKWKDRIFNVHPSLLPDFAGMKDADVHALAIERMRASGNNITGCTVHLATPHVDAGPIIIQKSCTIETHDTEQSLKTKVQLLEKDALIELLQLFRQTGGQDLAWDV